MHVRRAILFATTLVAFALLAACEEDEEPATPTPTPGVIPTGTPESGTPGAAGAGISIQEALDRESTDPVLVIGFLLVPEQGEITEEAEAQFCEALRDATPPECEGASMEVLGLTPDVLELLQPELVEGDGTRWSKDQLELLGVVEAGALRLDPTVR
jgi:hypothetical protein